MKKRIAIIGAGLSGLTLARELAGVAEICVFEKARGVGGRMSTRYVDPFYFDHGAQFFTARTPPFKTYLEPLIAKGYVAEWTGKVITLEEGKGPEKRLWYEPHYVASPNMNSLCKILAEDCNVSLNTEVAPLSIREGDGWNLTDKSGKMLGLFDWVISTAPPAQTVKLFADHIPADAAPAQVAMQGCYTLMLGFNTPWDKSWIGAKIHNSPLEWIAVNSTKPGRNNAVTSLVVHSRNDWAEEHIDDDMQASQHSLLTQFTALTGIDVSKADYVSTHRWRYALVSSKQKINPYVDTVNRLASTGDWCHASRIEDVWDYAMKLAGVMRTTI